MIPEQRIRELAAYASDPCADVQHWLAAELLATRAELAAINETLASIEAALIDAGIGPIGNLGKRVGDLAYQRDEARADAESARRDGQEIAAGLHEKLHELRAENERMAKQRDEARGVVARVVEIIDGSDGGVPASAADVWNLCDKWRHQWVMEAKAIAAEQTKAAPCFSDLPVYEQPKPAGGA